MEFIKYCDRHRILLMILPPYSTHTLQPLDGLKEALQHKKKHRKKGKALDLQQRQEEAVRERDQTEEKLQKAWAKKQRKEAQLQRQVELEEKRVERQRLKEMREVKRAEKAAERARKVEAQH
ncbi:conserved hypothetical protein [Pyrenophora tritici-repentis Pt-1C-BFP]|uniref:DDE-1 domain-containing protein n=1 Tax=Pyrenophora tritici-repentis (strain Pt-1C-BFP) TaxID=426418 RepID=B2W8U1_PYRTR|nr:uncharacterized protein PTRG_06399 [Pyrenophora tritici-repentis Pt-1C-BFP]EDU49319.1 conserved hypothetical protein [Pyrenophora tritici-repentis Pt-1C-BFP]